MREGITVICGGYNEEKRAESFFKSVSMFDEIIFVNRQSTDRTCEIAHKYNAIVKEVPYVEPEKEYIVANKLIDEVPAMASNKWVINLTFADIVHPLLYKKLITIINRQNFRYTMVRVPWVEYLFGVEDEYIPRCNYGRPVLRNKVFTRPSVVTHHELDLKKQKIYPMLKDKRVAVHHMTYIGLQYSFKEQHIRYGLKEMVTYYSKLKHPKKEVLKTMFSELKDDTKRICGAFIKRPIKIAIHALAISSYRSCQYYLIIYLFLWAKGKRSSVDDLFSKILENLQVSPKNKKIPLRNITNMWLNVLKKGTISFMEDIFALISMITIVNIMSFLIIWDNSRSIPVEEEYEILKDKILKNEL